MTLKALIIDDETEVAKALQLLLKRTCPDVEVLHCCYTIDEALKQRRKGLHDILFLDIEMPGGSGFDVIGEKNDKEYVIFTTAYSQYAIKALKAGGRDYLLKPIDPDELMEAVEKARFSFEKSKKERTRDRTVMISVNIPTGVKLINRDDVLYIKASGRYSEVHCKTEQKYMVCKNIGEFEDELKDSFFFRVHKSYLINCSHVSGIRSLDGGFVELNGDVQIEISKRKKSEFIAFLK